MKRVNDLKHINEGEVISFGIKAVTEVKRVMEMAKGKEEVKTLFFM